MTGMITGGEKTCYQKVFEVNQRPNVYKTSASSVF